MKSLRTISSIILCLLVIISSTNFMVGIHLCSGNVQDIALFEKADSCPNEKKMPPCHRHESKPCCEDQTIIHESQDIKSDIFKLRLSAIPVFDIAQSFIVNSEIIPSEPSARVKYFHYDSPLRSSDLIVEHQVFLI